MTCASLVRFCPCQLLAVAVVCLGCSNPDAPPAQAPNPGATNPGATNSGAANSSGAADATATANSSSTADSGAVKRPTGGTLTGTIVFDGDEIPTETMVPIQTDPEICGKHGKEGVFAMEDYLIDPQTRGIRYVIVYLKGDAIRKWRDTPRTDIVLDNRNCRFEPHVALVTVGSTIEVKNSDDVYHTTHLYGPGGYQFNPGLRTKGESEKTELTRPGTYVVKCDRHGWMSAFLRVDDHPFHAVTDEKGRFEITGIPAGTHQVEVYHEKFGERPIKPEVLEVQIKADETATLDLKLSHSK